MPYDELEKLRLAAERGGYKTKLVDTLRALMAREREGVTQADLVSTRF